jgi:small subunit ribosomal protein S7
MPRKGSPGHRRTPADAKYGSTLVTQLTNRVMVDGKRSIAESIVYDALANIGSRTQGGDPISVLRRAVDNVKPQLEVKSRRVGGATYQVPIEVRPSRSTTLALRWLVGYARIRREHTMGERLAGELLDASNGVGAAVKRREDTHKMAEANRAFAHYRW